MERIVAITDLPNHGTFLKDKTDVEAEIHATRQGEAQSRCLRLCLHKMNEQNRSVFLRYHGLYDDTREQREKLALELGLTIGTLRVRINRIRSQLEKCVQQCLSSSPQVKKPPQN